MPSLGEGFCLPILEAQSQGCPVICGDVSAMPEIAGDGALLFSPTEPGALAAHIEALLTDSGLRERLAAAGHRNRSRFSWADSASRYHAVLVDALKEAG